jgi:hypothetical protein
LYAEPPGSDCISTLASGVLQDALVPFDGDLRELVQPEENVVRT